jgi:DNA-binding transcriptional ArsR family regulator
MKDKNLEIRDNRNKSMFRMDDEYLNGYARLCGTNATLVYLCLCRHADRHQESYPSVQTIAEKIGISRDSVMRGIKSLIEWNIITKERERRESAKWLNNRYTLLDKSVWKPKPSSTQQHRAKSQIEGSQVANQGKSQVAHSDTKDTHINTKDTHTKDTAETSSADVPLIIKEFESINPAVKRMYGNKTQRQACEDLINTYGLERILSIISKTLPKTNQIQYFPVILTPLQLRDKFSALESAIQKFKNEKTEKESKHKVAFY